jgi:hypothetical protein
MQEHLHAIALDFLKRGAPVYKVAFHLGIDAEELRNLNIWETLYELASSGRNTSATIFWLKTRAGAQTSPKQKEDDDYQYPPPIIRVVNNDGEPVYRD